MTPGGNLRLISSRLGMVPLPALFVMQLFVLVFKSFTIFVFTLSLIIVNFLSPLTLPLVEINCLPPANFVCFFKLDTTVEPLFWMPVPPSNFGVGFFLLKFSFFRLSHPSTTLLIVLSSIFSTMTPPNLALMAEATASTFPTFTFGSSFMKTSAASVEARWLARWGAISWRSL